MKLTEIPNKPTLTNRKQSISECIDPLWKEFRNKALAIILAADNMDEEMLAEREEDVQQHFRSKANTKFYGIMKKKLVEFEEECKALNQIWLKDEYPYNKTWIMNDPGMQQTLSRYPKLLDVLHFIDKQGKHDESITKPDLKSFSVNLRYGMKDERLYSHVIVNKEFFKKAERELGLKKITMQKYIQSLCIAGIIKKMKQLQTHGKAMLYIDGYIRVLPNLGRRKKERFLTKNKHLKWLRIFAY